MNLGRVLEAQLVEELEVHKLHERLVHVQEREHDTVVDIRREDLLDWVRSNPTKGERGVMINSAPATQPQAAKVYEKSSIYHVTGMPLISAR
jgi:hypothetical protein